LDDIISAAKTKPIIWKPAQSASNGREPSREATYKNTINILDEMNISEVRRYAMVDISPNEYQWMKRLENR